MVVMFLYSMNFEEKGFDPYELYTSVYPNLYFSKLESVSLTVAILGIQLKAGQRLPILLANIPTSPLCHRRIS